MIGFPFTFVILPEAKSPPRRRIDQEQIRLFVKDDDPVFDMLNDGIEFLQLIHALLERGGRAFDLTPGPVADPVGALDAILHSLHDLFDMQRSIQDSRLRQYGWPF